MTIDGQGHSLHSVPAPDVSGVGRLDNGCSAVLLQGGRHALSAAHCHAPAGGTVTFASGAVAKVAKTQLAPGWQGTPGVHDLALMTLTAPVEGATGYPIAAPAAVRLPCLVLIAGWGDGGTGLGAAAHGEPAALRYGYNEYDALLQPIERYGNRVAMFDFDDGSDVHNSLGRKGLAEYEAMLGPRDSGGPSFIVVGTQWQLAGIHVGIVTSKGTSFGGVGLDLRVAPYAAWIATEMRRAP